MRSAGGQLRQTTAEVRLESRPTARESPTDSTTGLIRGISVESAFTYSSHTWLHVLSRGTNRETIWEMLVRYHMLTA
jgi:hypothetical protein